MAIKESFGTSRHQSNPIDLSLPKNARDEHIDQARIDQIALNEAYYTALETAELLRSGEIPPTKATLRELARSALYLAKSDLATPHLTLDTFAIITADLYAARAHKTAIGKRVLRQFNHQLEAVYPRQKTDPVELAEATALRQAILHTTPSHSFEAAADEDWARATSDWIVTPANIPGHTTRTPPPPSKSPLDPTPWWNLRKLFSIKRRSKNNSSAPDEVK